MHRSIVTAGVGLLLAACQGSTARDEQDVVMEGTGSVTGSTTTGGPADPGFEDKLDLGPFVHDQPTSCVAYTEEAELGLRPADIIMVVDNSGSMGDEVQGVQQQLNAFSVQISESGVDARVVLVSASLLKSGLYGICIEPPLGSGGCPVSDSRPPAYLHVDREVDSRNSYHAVLATSSAWSEILRPQAVKHVIDISDDGVNMDPQTFWDGLIAVDPSFEEFYFHVAIPLSECDAAALYPPSANYTDLVDATMGVRSDLCLQDFAAIFDEISEGIVGASVLGCDFAYPESPAGDPLDPSEVNVDFTDADGNWERIGFVPTADDCDDVDDGWYYDDPVSPTRINLCPQTCDRIQLSAVGSRIDVVIGCETVPAG